MRRCRFVVLEYPKVSVTQWYEVGQCVVWGERVSIRGKKKSRVGGKKKIETHERLQINPKIYLRIAICALVALSKSHGLE